jgi:RHS repeat-associated protein
VVPYTQSFDEYIDYDKNGNIDRLHRFADQNEYGNVIEIDALGYHYEQHSNKLMKVTDATNFSAGFSDDGEDGDDSPDENDDYAYDDNGNMISDENKGITSIKYNHLNLPTSINFENGNKIHYLYTAAGVKVGKTVIQGGQDPVVTDYLGGFQYLNGNLQFFPQPEGYVSVVKFGPATLVINYAYQHKDHLGNIRLNYGKDPETNVLRVLEENHYYPFGLKHQNYNTGRRQLGKKEEILAGNLTLMPAFVLPTEDKPMAYKYKYNGKEFQDELGLNWYDYHARNYDPAIGRWMNMDPLADFYTEYTPYNYVGSNPVVRTDPTGMDWYTDKDGNFTYDPKLTKDNASERLKDIEGANYFGASGTHKVHTVDANGNEISVLSNHSLNADGSVTDLLTNEKLDAGSSFTDALGNNVNAYDDKPSEAITKNGEQFKSNDGNTYQLHNNEWVKLSGIMVDPAAYRGISSMGYVPSIGNVNYVDQALLESSGRKTLSDALGLEGLLSGMAIESIANKKPSAPSPGVVVLGIIYNMYSGMIHQIKDNQTHDEQAEKARR